MLFKNALQKLETLGSVYKKGCEYLVDVGSKSIGLMKTNINETCLIYVHYNNGLDVISFNSLKKAYRFCKI